jgi:uncharacterized phage protein (TIGR02218 family)
MNKKATYPTILALLLITTLLVFSQTSSQFPELDKNGRPLLPRPMPHMVYSPTDLAHAGIALPASVGGATPNTSSALDELTRSSAKLTVNAGTAYLSMQLPALILQPGCTNTLFDARCGLLKASFANNLAVQAGSTANKIITASAQPDTYFDNGQLVFTSGPNAGLVKAVRQYLSGLMSFNSPLPYAPNAGDAFTAYPGCDKTQTTCSAKFTNLVNFEGFPYVPAPEAAI